MSKLDDVRDKIKRSVKCTDYLTKAKKGGYICPVCHSGEGQNGTGAVKYYPDTNTWACHACEHATGRKTGGDVIKLYELTYGVTYKEALKALGQAAGIDVETQRGEAKGQELPASNGGIPIPATKVNIPANYERYYSECLERLPMAADYLASRGISMETAETYAVGFDPKADPARSGHACPRLIIPVSSSYYVARRTDGGSDFKKMGPKGSAPDIFNVSVIDDGKREIFVTEGAIDALSVIEAGADAIALNSASNAGRLVEMLEKNRPKAAFILCLDNDTAGKRATETLRDGLTRLNIPFAVADICGGGKGSERGTMQRQSPFPISGREGEEACNHKAG